MEPGVGSGNISDYTSGYFLYVFPKVHSGRNHGRSHEGVSAVKRAGLLNCGIYLIMKLVLLHKTA